MSNRAILKKKKKTSWRCSRTGANWVGFSAAVSEVRSETCDTQATKPPARSVSKQFLSACRQVAQVVSGRHIPRWFWCSLGVCLVLLSRCTRCCFGPACVHGHSSPCAGLSRCGGGSGPWQLFALLTSPPDPWTLCGLTPRRIARALPGCPRMLMLLLVLWLVVLTRTPGCLGSGQRRRWLLGCGALVLVCASVCSLQGVRMQPPCG